MKNITKRNDLLVYVVCLFTALGLLALCSKSSPLYPLNDWPDINCFYTVGKGIVHGKVPYVDLLEQKGPYIYILGAIAYLIDGNGFLGYFLIEIISMYFFLLYAYKISSLYCKNTCLWMLPFLGAAVMCAKSFVHGGSFEQLSLGIFAYAIYTLLAILREENSLLDTKTLIVNGVLAGLVLWSKFNLLGLYIAWVLVIAILYLHRRQWAALGKAALIFGGGSFDDHLALSDLFWGS